MTTLTLLLCGIVQTVSASQFAYNADRTFTYTDAATHIAYRCTGASYGRMDSGEGVAMQTLTCDALTVFVSGFEG